jgi:hypothetical protein
MGPAEPLNPYQAPRAEPVAIESTGQLSPAIEDAIAGRYHFTIGGVMSEAWQLVKGLKASLWGALIVVGVIGGVVQIMAALILGLLIGNETSVSNVVVKQLFNLLIGALMTPLTMGLQMMCVRRALGLPVSFGTAFEYFHRGGPAIVGALLVMLLGYLGLALLIIPGIYLFVAYSLSTQLIADQQFGAWRAMETSRRAITHRWFGVFGLFLLVAVVTGLSALALLIPLIWTIPWAMMTVGVLYRRIFYARA